MVDVLCERWLVWLFRGQSEDSFIMSHLVAIGVCIKIVARRRFDEMCVMIGALNRRARGSSDVLSDVLEMP